MDKYDLLGSPPLVPPDTRSIRVFLDSRKTGQLSPGDPVLFRDYRVSSVETSTFDTQKHNISYQLFINAPYDRLVTSNVRFWKDSGIAVDLTSMEMCVEMGSLTTLLGGSVSFNMPEGLDLGQLVAPKTALVLYDDQKGIQGSLYADHIDYLMSFRDSIHGLQPGTLVEFRGIHLGTISKVPFFAPNTRQTFNDDYRTPVLICIKPERLKMQLGENTDVVEHLGELLERGLRGSLKAENLVTGTLYVDLDFCPNTPAIADIHEFSGYQIIPTVGGSLIQIQRRLMKALDKVSRLPLNPMVEQAISTLSENQRTMKNLQTILDSMSKILASQPMQQLPTDMQSTLRELDHNMQGFQPSSAAYNKMVTDMQRPDQMLQELQPVLKTLSEKSNALVFKAKGKKDPEPKRTRQ